MALQQATSFEYLRPPFKEKSFKLIPSLAVKIPHYGERQSNNWVSSSKVACSSLSSNFLKFPSWAGGLRRSVEVRSLVEKLGQGDRGAESSDSEDDDDDDDDYSSAKKNVEDEPFMNLEERCEWRQTIREVINQCPDVEEEVDPILADYPRLLWMRRILIGLKMLMVGDSALANSLTRLPLIIKRRMMMMMMMMRMK